jgi:preprotein translocase SecF subunit
MYKIVERRPIWYLITLVLILPGIIYMIWSLATTGSPLPLSIDYTGGTSWEMRFANPVETAAVRAVFVDNGHADTTVYTVNDEQTVQAKFETIDTAQKDALAAALIAQFGEFEELAYRSIGPSIGSEVGRAAMIAVVVAAGLILVYIAVAFRQVPHSFRYGTCAVIALVHDVLVTISFVALMNLIAGWEIDALFLTAILTVIGYSVNDTIVMFDRIRENVRRHRGETFATIANRSLLETVTRSLSTQTTVFLVLTAILIFGGASLRQFMATMLVGMVSGAYSSIFCATPLLVAWEERSLLGVKQPSPTVSGSRAVTA